MSFVGSVVNTDSIFHAMSFIVIKGILCVVMQRLITLGFRNSRRVYYSLFNSFRHCFFHRHRLHTIKVPGAAAELGTWKDEQSEGIYTRSYSAVSVGDELVSTLIFSGWGSQVRPQSNTYSIVAGPPSVKMSHYKIATTIYDAGDLLSSGEVTLVLRDINDNPAEVDISNIGFSAVYQASEGGVEITDENYTGKIHGWSKVGDRPGSKGTYKARYTPGDYAGWVTIKFISVEGIPLEAENSKKEELQTYQLKIRPAGENPNN
ncbi:MAG: hypothetical protein XXXJIFNMEKO3_03341 [Candidatus Erwinia impunctatus]|nr:hypothetical protein XXXJIFNMEKO_03341 [Culicoides impunctatus]